MEDTYKQSVSEREDNVVMLVDGGLFAWQRFQKRQALPLSRGHYLCALIKVRQSFHCREQLLHINNSFDFLSIVLSVDELARSKTVPSRPFREERKQSFIGRKLSFRDDSGVALHRNQ